MSQRKKKFLNSKPYFFIPYICCCSQKSLVMVLKPQPTLYVESFLSSFVYLSFFVVSSRRKFSEKKQDFCTCFICTCSTYLSHFYVTVYNFELILNSSLLKRRDYYTQFPLCQTLQLFRSCRCRINFRGYD